MSSLSIFLNKIYISKFLFYSLVLLIFLSFSITFYLLLPNNDLVKDPLILQFLLLLDVIFVLILISIIIIVIFIIHVKNVEKFIVIHPM